MSFFKTDNFPYFLLILLIAIFLNLPHVLHPYADTNSDFYLHYNWAKEFTENVMMGDLYPRWIYHGRYGLGEPVFITYSPLYFYLSAIPKTLGLTTWASMQIVEIATNFLFGVFIFLAARLFVPAKLAIVAAAAAVMSPFLVMLHYKFQGFPWASAGYMTHGMLLWAVLRRRERAGDINILAAVAIALSVGAHIISALVNLICISFLFLAIAWRGRDDIVGLVRRCIVGWGGTVAIGLLLSGIYLIPALYRYDTLNTAAWTGSYRLEAFAWPLITLLRGELQWFSFQWPISLPALVMAVGALVFYIGRRAALQDGATRFFPAILALAGASVFFASELSYPVWTFQNPVSQINLPYRFVSVTYTAAALLMAVGMAAAARARLRGWFLFFAAMPLASILIGTAALVKGTWVDGRPLEAAIVEDRFTFEDLRKQFLQPGYFERCRSDRSECISSHRAAAGFRGVGEYQMKWAGPDYPKYAQLGFPAYCASLNMRCARPDRTGSGFHVQITAKSENRVVLPLFYYPNWAVSLDGAPLATDIDRGTGLISVIIGPGAHTLTVEWRTTGPEIAGAASTLGMLGMLGLIALQRSRKRRRAAPAPQPVAHMGNAG